MRIQKVDLRQFKNCDIKIWILPETMKELIWWQNLSKIKKKQFYEEYLSKV